MKKLLTSIFLFGGLFVLFAASDFAQDDSQTRSITSDAFAQKRPETKKPAGSKSAPAKGATYKYVKTAKAIKRKPSKIVKPPKAQKTEIADVGVTMWKLREPRTNEGGHKFPVQVNGLRKFWIAERVSSETSFQSGDRVRLAIESSVAGYLYVVNSEIYSNGTFGEPYLIFPATAGEDNWVEPGLLVDIPDQTEDLPYFLMNPKEEKYVGELLTVIVSPKPITKLQTDKSGKILNLENLMSFELSVDAEIFSRDDSEDSIYSETEADAACGSKIRRLERDASSKTPCGVKSRQLTREEPLPQTLIRVNARIGSPVVAFVQLNVRD